MKLIKHILLLALVVLISAGCTPSVTYVVDVEYTPELKEEVTTKPEKIQIAIVPFEDARDDKMIIGTRRHIFGRIDKFDARPAPVTDAVTQALVSAMKIRGYQTVVLQKGTTGEGVKQSPPHLIVSGKIEDLRADAQSKLGYTDIKTNVRLKVRVYKVDEKNSYMINVQSQSEPRVAFFNPSVMQKSVNDTLTDAINHLIANQLK